MIRVWWEVISKWASRGSCWGAALRQVKNVLGDHMVSWSNNVMGGSSTERDETKVRVILTQYKRSLRKERASLQSGSTCWAQSVLSIRSHLSWERCTRSLWFLLCPAHHFPCSACGVPGLLEICIPFREIPYGNIVFLKKVIKGLAFLLCYHEGKK